MAFLIGGANSAADTGYDIDNSLRAGDSTNYKLARTPSSNGSERIFTFSAWVKRGSITDNREILFRPDSGNPWADLEFQTDDSIICMTNGGSGAGVVTNRLFRDVSAWYHLVCAVDTTQSTEANRVKIYVNGVLETSFSESNYMAQNADTTNNQTNSFTQIFGDSYGNHLHMADVYWIDGTQYAASDFGETDEDSGIWKPKEAKNDLTFGTNGFFLEFKQTGTSQNSSGIGADTSGNDNHLAVTGFDAQDQTTDTPTNNFATILSNYASDEVHTVSSDFSEGNTKFVASTSAHSYGRCSIGVSSGKWYVETKITEGGNGQSSSLYSVPANSATAVGDDTQGAGWTVQLASSTTELRKKDKGSSTTIFTDFASGNIAQMALDLDNGKMWLGNNGSWYNDDNASATLDSNNPDITGLTSEMRLFAINSYKNDSDINTYEINFGNPSFTISSGNADANGYGNFEYAPPSGFYAVCTKNLAEFG